MRQIDRAAPREAGETKALILRREANRMKMRVVENIERAE